MRPSVLPLLFFIILALLPAGCGPDTTPSPTPVAGAPAGTATAVATAATPSLLDPTATPTPTPPPTHTPRPTATPSPLPTNTPSPTIPATVVVEAPGATLPPGFSMLKFADLYRPTGLTVDDAGRLYATSFDGTVHAFVDEDGDGRADVDRIVASGFNTPLGVAIHPENGIVYVSSNTRISILRDEDGDLEADAVEDFVTGLPVGLHQNDNLKFGPDGMIYMGVGSTCDACAEADPRSGTLMRFDPATGEGEVVATGMRNPYDLAFHPETGDLFATDNGRDYLGDDVPGEELNHVVAGGDYGWPGCWDDLQGPDCEGTIPAVAFFEPHSSANSIDFYTGDRFPAGTHHDLFVAIFGSWLVSGIETGIAQVDLAPAGDTYQGTVSWFAQWDGMPLGLITGPDGALYVGDYTNNAIYRISYGLP